MRLKDEKNRLRLQMLTALGGRKYLLRKLTKKLNSEAKAYRKSLDRTYRDKIEHYKKEQADLLKQEMNDTIEHCTDSLVGTKAAKIHQCCPWS